jgi:hypothetical protein
VFNCGGIAVVGGDTQAEQVGQSPDVAVGGLGFVEDPVLSNLSSGQPGSGGLPNQWRLTGASVFAVRMVTNR